MSAWRTALLVGLLAALLVDAVAYGSLPIFRAILSRNHWILYLYLGAGTTACVAGAVRLAQGLAARLRAS